MGIHPAEIRKIRIFKEVASHGSKEGQLGEARKEWHKEVNERSAIPFLGRKKVPTHFCPRH